MTPADVECFEKIRAIESQQRIFVAQRQEVLEYWKKMTFKVGGVGAAAAVALTSVLIWQSARR